MYGETLSFIDNQGAVRRYRDLMGGATPVFSNDGRYLLCHFYAKGSFLALFDDKGDMLWKRYEDLDRIMSISETAISSSGKYIAVARKNLNTKISYISVLDLTLSRLLSRYFIY